MAELAAAKCAVAGGSRGQDQRSGHLPLHTSCLRPPRHTSTLAPLVTLACVVTSSPALAPAFQILLDHPEGLVVTELVELMGPAHNPVLKAVLEPVIEDEWLWKARRAMNFFTRLEWVPHHAPLPPSPRPCH